MAELYAVGRKANRRTADEIIAGLEAMGNYVPTSEVTRRDYRNVLLKEYEEFIEVHDREKDKKMPPNAPEGGTGQ
ncbi:MAG TPA: hypothetical protein PLX02_12620 [Syntrophorhabdaceae bacterium]|nr:hypothetical protein [Syntrophorhabdaceae bacterium]HQM81158.1 hypothetical protein [Syntrophorhabdaceae bacterium]HQM82456.1 hypothetical protein [Syntrophorhabdaceae bacterium]